MASRQNTIDFILDQMTGLGNVSAKKMFGEYAIYWDEKMVGLVCDDQLFIKETPKNKAFLGEWEKGAPYPGAKPCFVIPGEKWEEREWLSQLMKLTASDLSVPKGKSKPRTERKAR